MINIEAPLIEGFILLNRFFKIHKIRYCLIGGLAAGFWGKPRYTRDIDFTVASHTGDFKNISQWLTKAKFKFEQKGSNQLQIFNKDKISFQVDLILVETEYQDWVIQRAQIIKMFNLKIPICSPEDLIILKLIANRRQDLLDIENVLQNKTVQLNKEYLFEWFKFWELEDRFKKEFGENILLK